MKRTISFLLTLTMILTLLGCGKAEQQSTRVYSIHGGNEQISVTNGGIVLGEEKDVFQGGNLQVAEEIGVGVVSYTTRFYFLLDGERDDFFRMELVNGGEMLRQNPELGSSSGSGGFQNIRQKSFESWKDSLFFELTTVDQSGNEQVYTLPMTITEVTS